MVVNIYDTIWCGRLSFSVVDYKSAFYCTLNTHYRIVWQILHVVQSWREASLATRNKIAQNWQLCSDVKIEQEAVLLFARILYLNPEYLPRESGARSESSNKVSDANLLTAFHRIYSVNFSIFIWFIFFITVDNWLLFVVDKVYDYDYDHGNDVSIVLSFRDMTTGRTTDGRTDRRRQA